MKRWEYMRIEHDDDDIVDDLDRLGADGWEAFSASERRDYHRERGEYAVVAVMLRREVPA